MRQFILATAAFAAIAAATPSAHADMVGAAAGAGVGLVVAGPVGAVAGGEAGVARAIEIIRNELDISMALTGVTSIAAIDRRMITAI